MEIWKQWWKFVKPLRNACSRERTFFWLVVVLIGFSVRTDLFGVSSFIRVLGLTSQCYDHLLDFFHGSGVDLMKLTTAWVQVVLNSGVEPVRSNGRLTIVVDGVKIAKEGKKMPSVKKMHQESESNTKPEFIMGHSFQAASILMQGVHNVFAIPLVARIHEGLKFSNRDKRTILDKSIELLALLDLPVEGLLECLQ